MTTTNITVFRDNTHLYYGRAINGHLPMVDLQVAFSSGSGGEYEEEV